jgi:large subunit ribosomal protein L5
MASFKWLVTFCKWAGFQFVFSVTGAQPKARGKQKKTILLLPPFPMLRSLSRRVNLAPRLTCRSFSTTPPAASSHGLLRLKEHYDSTLAEDLMLLGYDHSRVAPSTSKYPDLEVQIDRALQRTDDQPQESDAPAPYVTRTRKGGKPVKPIAPLKSANAVPGLDKITLHAMVKDAIGSKSNLLSAFMAFQSITGIRPEVVYARTSVANWKLR